MSKLPILPVIGVLFLAWTAVSAWANPPTLDRANASHQQGGGGHPAKTPRSSKDLLQRAIRTLEGTSSVSAKISQEANLFDKHLMGSGLYLEQQLGSVCLMRLELKLSDETGFLKQVCDGRYLWTHKKFLDRRELSRVDIARAVKALEAAKQTPPLGSRGILHSLGGLCKLLRQLRDNFDFTSVQPGLLKLQSGQLPIWQLRGQWKPHCLVKLLPEQKEMIESGKPVDPRALPDHLPDHVLLILGQDDLFPYRIEYRRMNGKGESKPLAIIRLFDVTINVPVDPSRFQYNPGEMEVQDGTDAYLRGLGVKQK